MHYLFVLYSNSLPKRLYRQTPIHSTWIVYRFSAIRSRDIFHFHLFFNDSRRGSAHCRTGLLMQ
nr:MAG TPA: hypothetical protein [Caudoviricetes sp.]